MKASMAIRILEQCKYLYGDRDIKFQGNGVIKNEDSIFIESIENIRLVENDPNDPFVFFGDSITTLSYQSLIKLNWFGKLIKKWIIQKQPPIPKYYKSYLKKLDER